MKTTIYTFPSHFPSPLSISPFPLFFIFHFNFPSSVPLFPSLSFPFSPHFPSTFPPHYLPLFHTLPFPLSHNKSLTCPLKSEKYQKNIRMPFFLSFHLRYPHSFNNSPSIHLSNLVTSTTGNMSGPTKYHKYLKNVLLNSSTLKF